MEHNKVNGMTFKQWMTNVDKHMCNYTGLTSDDLPDLNYWDMWYSEVSPLDVAIEVLSE